MGHMTSDRRRAFPDVQNAPGAGGRITILSAFSARSIAQIGQHFAGRGDGEQTEEADTRMTRCAAR